MNRICAPFTSRTRRPVHAALVDTRAFVLSAGSHPLWERVGRRGRVDAAVLPDSNQQAVAIVLPVAVSSMRMCVIVPEKVFALRVTGPGTTYPM